MPRTFVDLSIWLENDVLSDPPPFAPRHRRLLDSRLIFSCVKTLTRPRLNWNLS